MRFFSNDGIGEVKGLFSVDHLIFSLVGIILVVIMVLLMRKLTYLKIKKLIRVTFFIVLGLEILKIIWNLTIRENVTFNQWIPLYFCSLFIYALGLAGYGKGKVERIGLGFMFYGGIVAGLSFILYPSSALLEQPLLHCLTFHSLIYHVMSVVLGLLIVITGYFKPNIKDFYGYVIFTGTFCLIAYIFNIITNSNLMFIMTSNGIWPLSVIEKIFGVMYPLIISIIQIVSTFFISFGVYKLVIFLKAKAKND